MSKSEELAKLLKVPKKFQAYNALYNEFDFFLTREEAEENGYVDISPNAYYPDYTKPNNFTKLYEMPIQNLGNGVIRTLGKLVKPANNRNDFIENIFERAEDENTLGGDFWKTASEQAQQTDWEY